MDRVTIATYDKAARDYDSETAEFWNTFPHQPLDAFVNRVQGCVLNLGSGPGKDGLLLKERGLEVTCLDASESMLELSRSRGMESVKGEFASLPFGDGSFDGAWSYTGLLHIPKGEMSQALKGKMRRMSRRPSRS